MEHHRDSANVFGIQINGVAEVVPPTHPLLITRVSSSSVDLSWQTEANKTYQLLRSPDLPGDTPTNLITAIGSDGTTSQIPATLTLINHGWTNFGGIVTGTGATNHTPDSIDRPNQFYKMVSFPQPANPSAN